MTSNIYFSFHSLNNLLTLERNSYFCFSLNNYFCCSSYSLNLANIALDLLMMITVSYYLFYALHSTDFFRKMSIFSKIISALHYYDFGYVGLKYPNKYQQCFVNLLTEWCFFVCSLFFYSRLLFMSFNRATNSFYSYH